MEEGEQLKPRKKYDPMYLEAVGTTPSKKRLLEYDSMYGNNSRPGDCDVELEENYAKSVVGYCLSPEADLGGMKKREEKCEYEWKYA